jgi:Tfp pilus assembly protein PilN
MSTVSLEGFNLLPHRSGARRRARNRTIALLSGAGLAGCVAVGAVAAWDALERVHVDEQREDVEAELRQLSVPVAEHAKLVDEDALRRRAQTVAVPIAEPRARFLGLLEALAHAASQGSVALQRVTQRAHEVELAASAPDSHAAAAWLKTLESVGGVRAVEVVVRRRAAPAAVSKSASKRGSAVQGGGAYDFIAVVRWADGSAPERAAKLLKAGKPESGNRKGRP